MPITERHEQTSKALETLAKCGRPPKVDGGEHRFCPSRQGGRVGGGVTSKVIVRRLATHYGTSSQ